jgi:hypothetical protein
MSEGKLYEKISDIHADNDVIVEAFMVLDKAKKELDEKLATIIKNSEILSTDTEKEKLLKKIVIMDACLDTYKNWVKKYFGGKNGKKQKK